MKYFTWTNTVTAPSTSMWTTYGLRLEVIIGCSVYNTFYDLNTPTPT